ncbi:hypothetical protein D3C77_597820 [compost metagenome]
MQRFDQTPSAFLALAIRIQHGLLQARHQRAEAVVEIAVAQHLAHLPQAVFHRRIGTFDRHAAAYQAAPQQIDALLPVLLDLLLLFEQAQVFFLPAFGLDTHDDGSSVAGSALPLSASGRRISIATGR